MVRSAGDGEREIIPEARLGFPMERRTVSIVFSIFRRERVRISCFLWRVKEGPEREGDGYFDERFPRLDSSKTHSWLLARQRLQGGPCSAPTHFILRRLQTVHALEDVRERGGERKTPTESRVWALALTLGRRRCGVSLRGR